MEISIGIRTGCRSIGFTELLEGLAHGDNVSSA